MSCLIQAAIQYARGQGARIIEAYPLQSEIARRLPYERFMGIESTFERAGFQVVARRSHLRSIMRYYVRETDPLLDLYKEHIP